MQINNGNIENTPMNSGGVYPKFQGGLQGQPGGSQGQPGGSQGQPGGGQGQPGVNQGQPGGGQGQPGVNQGQPGGGQGQPGVNQGQFGGSQGQPGVNQGQFGGSQGQPGVNQGQFGGSQGQPGVNQGQPGGGPGQGGFPPPTPSMPPVPSPPTTSTPQNQQGTRIKIKSVFADRFVVVRDDKQLSATAENANIGDTFRMIRDGSIARLALENGRFIRVDRNGFLVADTNMNGATLFMLFSTGEREYVLRAPDGLFVSVRANDNRLVARAENTGPRTRFKFRRVD